MLPCFTTTLIFSILLLYTSNTLVESAACPVYADICDWLEWDSWSDCTKECGGGSHERYRFLCCETGEDFNTCAFGCGYYDSSKWYEHEECNTVCYNGGTYSGSYCNCLTGNSGLCCETAPIQGGPSSTATTARYRPSTRSTTSTKSTTALRKTTQRITTYQSNQGGNSRLESQSNADGPVQGGPSSTTTTARYRPSTRSTTSTTALRKTTQRTTTYQSNQGGNSRLESPSNAGGLTKSAYIGIGVSVGVIVILAVAVPLGVWFFKAKAANKIRSNPEIQIQINQGLPLEGYQHQNGTAYLATPEMYPTQEMEPPPYTEADPAVPPLGTQHNGAAPTVYSNPFKAGARSAAS